MSAPRDPLAALSGLAYGGDYNAEQWPREVWADDVRLMREAGVTMMTVGVFSWALLEPEEGRYELGWLRDLMDLLHEGGVAVDLATPTAAPPPWFALAHPEALPVTREGVRLGVGAREHFCPSSPAYRRAATGIARELATQLGDHPALAMWHVGNEFGSHVGQCWCHVSRDAFVAWLRERHRDLETLNRVWGTTFWSQRYASWEQVGLPGPAPMPSNPGQQLDFLRFSSEENLRCYLAEADVLRELTPDVPVMTNFMATSCRNLDYWRWVEHVDLVTNNHYLTAADLDAHIGLAQSADVSRGLAHGDPWLLMEHSTSAVNWQPRNIAKTPGQMRRNSLAHVARGSEGAMFFQWRASAFGAEKFHSAMVPQAGEDSRAWREVVALGEDLRRLAPVRGTRVRADVALVWDWEAWWALELEFRPSVDVTYRDRVDAWYRAAFDLGLTVDVVAPDGDLSAYPLVVVPSLYLTSHDAARRLGKHVEAGGHVLVSFFSGVVDETETVPPGPYPGMLRELLGLHVEEFHPLREGEQVEVDALGGPTSPDGSDDAPGDGRVTGVVADVWSESVVTAGAKTVASFTSGPDAGGPAVTWNRHGDGVAWYAATRLSADGTRALLHRAAREAGCRAHAAPAGVEVVRRADDRRSFLFLLNHTQEPARLAGRGTDLLTGRRATGEVVVPAGGVVVLQEDDAPPT